jgi:amyloid beta precursor protein binding protein 1
MFTFPISPEDLELIQDYGTKHKVPLISIHSVGFYSYFRINLPGSFPIVDTHPDSTATTDLRLLTPWEELSKFAEDLTKDIENLSPYEHGHIPYVALLLHYLGRWKEEHGSLPATYKEKTAFRDFISAGARTDTPEGGEENFDEAVAAVLKTITSPSLPSAVREVFEYKPSEVRTILAPIRRSLIIVAVGSELEFLDYCRCHKTILCKAQGTPIAWLSP